MVWFLVSQIFSTLIALIQIDRLSESDKDLEIMVLCYQLGIAERKLKKPVRANHAERLTLALLNGVSCWVGYSTSTFRLQATMPFRPN